MTACSLWTSLKLKKNIKTSQEAHPDGISLEVLKYCDLDETVPAVCNQASYKPWQARPVVRKFPYRKAVILAKSANTVE